MWFIFLVSEKGFSELPEVVSKMTYKSEECWLGQLTFDRVKNFLDSLRLVAVWSAARCDLQHVIRTVLCEELWGRGEDSPQSMQLLPIQGLSGAAGTASCLPQCFIWDSC